MTTDHTRSRLDALADRLLDLDSPVYGDEGQRQVTLQAVAFSWTLGLILLFAAAIFSAATGAAGSSLGYIIIAGVISMSANWYAARRGVKFEKLVKNDLRTTMKIQLAMMLALAAWAGALAFYGFTGSPLLDLGSGREVRTGAFWAYVAAGGVVGALLGGILSVVSIRRAPDTDDALEPDDKF